MVINPKELTECMKLRYPTLPALEKALDEAYKSRDKIERPFKEFTFDEIAWTKKGQQRPQHKIAHVQHIKYSNGSEDWAITYTYRYSKRQKTPKICDEINYHTVKIEILKRLIYDEVTRRTEQQQLHKRTHGKRNWTPVRRLPSPKSKNQR